MHAKCILFIFRYNNDMYESEALKDTLTAESKLMELFQTQFLSLLGSFQYVCHHLIVTVNAYIDIFKTKHSTLSPFLKIKIFIAIYYYYCRNLKFTRIKRETLCCNLELFCSMHKNVYSSALRYRSRDDRPI